MCCSITDPRVIYSIIRRRIVRQSPHCGSSNKGPGFVCQAHQTVHSFSASRHGQALLLLYASALTMHVCAWRYVEDVQWSSQIKFTFVLPFKTSLRLLTPIIMLKMSSWAQWMMCTFVSPSQKDPLPAEPRSCTKPSNTPTTHLGRILSRVWTRSGKQEIVGHIYLPYVFQDVSEE